MSPYIFAFMVLTFQRPNISVKWPNLTEIFSFLQRCAIQPVPLTSRFWNPKEVCWGNRPCASIMIHWTLLAHQYWNYVGWLLHTLTFSWIWINCTKWNGLKWTHGDWNVWANDKSVVCVFWLWICQFPSQSNRNSWIPLSVPIYFALVLRLSRNQIYWGD